MKKTYYSNVFCLLAETNVTPPFKSNSESNLLHELQTGRIYSPKTFLLIICAPNVAILLQPRTEHSIGQCFPELLIQ